LLLELLVDIEPLLPVDELPSLPVAPVDVELLPRLAAPLDEELPVAPGEVWALVELEMPDELPLFMPFVLVLLVPVLLEPVLLVPELPLVPLWAKAAPAAMPRTVTAGRIQWKGLRMSGLQVEVGRAVRPARGGPRQWQCRDEQARLGFLKA